MTVHTMNDAVGGPIWLRNMEVFYSVSVNLRDYQQAIWDLKWSLPRLNRFIDESIDMEKPQRHDILDRWLRMSENVAAFDALEPDETALGEIRTAVKRVKGILDAR